MVVVLVALAMAVGLAGTIVPVVPGLGLVWAAAGVYGLAEGFGGAGTVAMVVITALAIAGTVVGVAVPRRRAAAAGAATSSMWLGVAMAVVGFFVVPVIGLPVGGVLGVYVGERVRTGDAGAAWRSTRATLVGFGVAAALQLAAGFAMVITWVAWVVAG